MIDLKDIELILNPFVKLSIEIDEGNMILRHNKEMYITSLLKLKRIIIMSKENDYIVGYNDYELFADEFMIFKIE